MPTVQRFSGYRTSWIPQKSGGNGLVYRRVSYVITQFGRDATDQYYRRKFTMNSSGIYLNLLAQLKKLTRHNRQGSFKTRERYEESMKRFCRFLDDDYRLEKLDNIAPKHVLAYVEHMQQKELKPATIKTELAAIRFWHDKLLRPRFKLPDNTELSLERRSFGKVNRTWEIEEFNRFLIVCLQYTCEDYATIACLARYAGLRIHECFRLDTATAEQAVKTELISVKGKGGRLRTIPINDSIRIGLEQMLEVTPRGHKLFVPQDSQTDIEIERMQQFIIQHRHEFQSGERTYPLHMHGLRHTYAQDQYLSLVASGHTQLAAELMVSKLLGHTRPDVTRIYLAGAQEE